MKLIASLTVMIASTVALAGDCVFKVHRTPCSKETEKAAFMPYGGANPSEEKQKKAQTEKACLDEMNKQNSILRPGTVTKKVITAFFDGKKIAEVAATRECK